MARKYSNVSSVMSLTASVTATDTQVTVNDATGLPVTFPYSIAVDYEAANVEIMLVIGTAGNTLIVDRGQEDTAAQPHSVGAVVVHAATATDLQDAANHRETGQGQHGVGQGSDIVGTGTTQTLSNKTISGTNNTLRDIPGSEVKNIPGTNITSLPAAKVTSPFTTPMTFNDDAIFKDLVTADGNIVINQLPAGVGLVINSNNAPTGFGALINSDPAQAGLVIRRKGSATTGAVMVALQSDAGINMLTFTRDGVLVAGSAVFTRLEVNTGNVYLGNQSTDTTISLNFDKKEGADTYRFQLLSGATGIGTLTVYKNGVDVNRIRIFPDGNIYLGSVGQPVRPLPYAQSTHYVTLNFANSHTAKATITLPAGRFTQPPVITATNWEEFYNAAISPVTTTSFGVSLRQIDAVAVTGPSYVHCHAIQMLATAAPGLAQIPVPQQQEDAMVTLVATCRTPDCFNTDIPIEIQVVVPEGTDPLDSAVVCGMCSQPITDLQYPEPQPKQ